VTALRIWVQKALRSDDWPLGGTFLSFSTADAWSVGVGAGVLLIGLGIFVLCIRTGGLIARFKKTLDEIDRQIPALSTPIATTLTHVGGIADTADVTIARLGVAVAQLETVAAGATKTANTIGTLVNTVAENVRKG
jgi:uncharacterized protein YoxC